MQKMLVLAAQIMQDEFDLEVQLADRAIWDPPHTVGSAFLDYWIGILPQFLKKYVLRDMKL